MKPSTASSPTSASPQPLQSWLSQLVTTQDLSQVLRWLVSARESLYQQQRQQQLDTPQVLQPLLEAESLSEHLIQDLEQATKHLPVVSLQLTYQPHTRQIQELSQLLRQQLHNPLLLLQIEYHPELIGGCVVEYQGQRHDWSLNTSLLKLDPKSAEPGIKS